MSAFAMYLEPTPDSGRLRPQAAREDLRLLPLVPRQQPGWETRLLSRRGEPFWDW